MRNFQSLNDIIPFSHYFRYFFIILFKKTPLKILLGDLGNLLK